MTKSAGTIAYAAVLRQDANTKASHRARQKEQQAARARQVGDTRMTSEELECFHRDLKASSKLYQQSIKTDHPSKVGGACATSPVSQDDPSSEPALPPRAAVSLPGTDRVE